MCWRLARSLRRTVVLLAFIVQSPGAERGTFQISSIKISPSAIHASAEPNEAVITVQLSAAGVLPVGAQATLGVATYSSDPLGNNVGYDDEITLPVTTSPTVFKFKVHGDRDTLSGHLIVIAEIRSTSPGVTVKDCEPSNCRARLETAAP